MLGVATYILRYKLPPNVFQGIHYGVEQFSFYTYLKYWSWLIEEEFRDADRIVLYQHPQLSKLTL